MIGHSHRMKSHSYRQVDSRVLARGWMLGNGQRGVFLTDADNNMIGAAGQGNLIAANTFGGVGIETGSDNNTVSANLIGVAYDGSTIVGGQLFGVDIADSIDNTIGGGIGQGNVISGHTNDGVKVSGIGSTGNQIAGNSIGFNGLFGVFIDGAANNIIGIDPNAIDASAGNSIDGNQHGVEISGADSTGNVVAGNEIGLLSPNGDGVRLFTGASANTIGGSHADLGNIISDNSSLWNLRSELQ